MKKFCLRLDRNLPSKTYLKIIGSKMICGKISIQAMMKTYLFLTLKYDNVANINAFGIRGNGYFTTNP